MSISPTKTSTNTARDPAEDLRMAWSKINCPRQTNEWLIVRFLWKCYLEFRIESLFTSYWIALSYCNWFFIPRNQRHLHDWVFLNLLERFRYTYPPSMSCASSSSLQILQSQGIHQSLRNQISLNCAFFRSHLRWLCLLIPDLIWMETHLFGVMYKKEEAVGSQKVGMTPKIFSLNLVPFYKKIEVNRIIGVIFNLAIWNY